MGDGKEFWDLIQPEGISIEVQNDERSFAPGDTIQGSVKLVTNQDLVVREITLKFEGNIQIYGLDKKSPLYNELKAKILLLGNSKENSETNTLTLLYPGTHEYPFTYTLPKNLPLSFQSPKWTLTYFMVVRMVKDQGTSQTYVLPFEIKGTLDLNEITGLNQLAELYKNKKFCCGCVCGQRCTVGLTVVLLRRGFIPGEFVDFLFEIENLGHLTITNVCVRIVQNVIATAGGGYKKLLGNVVAEVVGWEVGAGCRDLWRGVKVLQVPDVPPSNIDGKRSLGIEYDFQIEVEVSGCSKSYKGNIPIVIGTIPLKTIDHTYVTSQMQTSSSASMLLSRRESSAHTGDNNAVDVRKSKGA